MSKEGTIKVTMVDDTHDVQFDTRQLAGHGTEREGKGGKKRTLVSNNPLLMPLIFDADGQVNVSPWYNVFCV